MVAYIRPSLLEMELEVKIHMYVTYLRMCSQRRQVRNEEAGQPRGSADQR